MHLALYVIDLAAYASGQTTVGLWITLPLPKRTLELYIQEVLARGSKVLDAKYYNECMISHYYFDSIVPFEINPHEDLYGLNTSIKKLSRLDKHRQLSVAFLLQEGYVLTIQEALLRAEDFIVCKHLLGDTLYFTYLQHQPTKETK